MYSALGVYYLFWPNLQGHSWPVLIIPDHFWSVLIFPDQAWSFLIKPDQSWSFLTSPDHSWPILNIFDQSWSFLTSPEIYIAKCESVRFRIRKGDRHTHRQTDTQNLSNLEVLTHLKKEHFSSSKTDKVRTFLDKSQISNRKTIKS